MLLPPGSVSRSFELGIMKGFLYPVEAMLGNILRASGGTYSIQRNIIDLVNNIKTVEFL